MVCEPECLKPRDRKLSEYCLKVHTVIYKEGLTILSLVHAYFEWLHQCIYSNSDVTSLLCIFTTLTFFCKHTAQLALEFQGQPGDLINTELNQ